MSDILIKNSCEFIKGNVEIPTSKSYANRALIISALAKGTSILQNMPECDDVIYLVKALGKLNIAIEKSGKNLTVHGCGGSFKNVENTELFCGIAGTTSRFLVSLAALTGKEITISGEGQLLERPVGDLCKALESIGVFVEYLQKNQCIPVVINGSNLRSVKNIEIKGNISSQFISSLLMITPYLPGNIEINVQNHPVSASYIDITLDIMRSFNVNISHQNYTKYIANSQQYQAKNYTIEGDWSSASYFFALSLLTNSTITLENLSTSSTQGDAGIVKIFKQIGLNVAEKSGTFYLAGGVVTPVEINMENMPDSAMTIICVLAFASGKSTISGLSTLKNKETNRLLALHQELAKIGVKTEVFEDGITIHGSPDIALEKIVKIETYHDHRMAMCFGILGAKLGNIVIKNKEVVSKSYPNFWESISNIGVICQEY